MITLPKFTIALAVAALATASTSSYAQPDPEALRASIVQIVVMDASGEVRRVRSGFAISTAGHVATVAHGVVNESRITVVPLETREAMPARLVHSNQRADVALLAVDGLEQTPLALAKDGFAAGRLVYSAGVWGEPGQTLLAATATATGNLPASISEGAVGQHSEIPAASGRPAVSLIMHNAMIPAAGYGGPLLNECGEVAGVNRGAPDVSARRLRDDRAPETVVYGAAGSAIAGLLLPAGIAFAQSETECAPARSVAQAQAAEAQAQAEAAAAEAGEAQAQAERAERQAEEKGAELEARQQALDAAEDRVSELQAQYDEAVRTGAEAAETLQAELAGASAQREEAQAAVSAAQEELAALRTQREAEAQANRVFWGVAAVVVLLLAVLVAIVVVRLRRRSRDLESVRQQAVRAEQDAAEAQRAAQRAQAEAEAPLAVPDCLLAGETSSGQPVSVKLPGRLLAGEGAVIGRSPRNATFLIDDETLSREHARMSVEAEAGLRIQDLGSTNGTRLNGRRLQPETPASVANEDVIELGGVKLRVAWEA